MKYYIKSDSASDYIHQNQRRPEGGYLYIFKHGIGPGTLPRDVEVIKTKDLPNNYTAVWTDRWLTTSELREYDIPSETDINYYLDRIGYCKKDGDVVPCNSDNNDIDRIHRIGTEKGYIHHLTKDTVDDEVIDTISNKGKIKASKTYHFSRYNGESYTTRPDGTKVLSRKVLQRNVLDMLEDNDKYMNLDFSDAEVITEEATPEELLAIYDEEMTSEEFKALYNRIFGVEACGDIKASTEPKYMANMVSCSSEDAYYDDNFLVEGYYDNQYRGLAESAETSDVSALNEYINDYANRGYFIKVHNLTDGTITQFSPDNWFNDIAPDGGAELFMSW